MALPSTIKQSIQDILSTLNAMVDQNGNQLWQTVAVWNDHLNRAMKGDGYSFLFPAAFVEIQDFAEEVWGLGVSTQDINITIHICHRQEDAGDGTLDQNLDVFDYRTYVRKQFTNLDISNCGTLMFSKEKEDFKHRNVYHFLETFKTKYVDVSGSPYLNGTFIIKPSGTWTITTTEGFVPDL